MAGVNKVILIGNLGSDPELKHMPSGDRAVCNFSIATSESWTDKKTGEKQERTEWHRIVVWGNQAEPCGKYLSTGSKVYVEGKLQTRSWEKDGVKRYTTEINAMNVQFLDKKGEGGGSRDSRDSGRSSGGGGDSRNHDDVPF